jgi:hypothetical protein
MSDEATQTTTSPANPVIASAQQALAVKELSEAVAGMRSKFRTLWIVVAVVAVIAVASAVFSIGPMFGLNLARRGNFPDGQFPTGGNRTFQNGGTQDQGQGTPAP